MKSKNFNMIKTAGTVFVLILVGKIFSLLREMYFSALFGTSIYADAYFTANIIPSLLNTPLTISSLVFFVPLYTKCREEEGEIEANYFVNNLMTIYVIFNTILCVLAFIASPLLIKLLASGYDEETYKYAVQISQLLVLSFPVTIAVHVLMNLSNAKQKHYAPQLLTLFNSTIAIVLMYFFVPIYGIYAVPVIGLFAWIFQLFFQAFCLRKEYRYSFRLNLRDPLIKTMIVLAVPTIMATAAEQINLSVDNVLCSSLGVGTVSILNYAQKLFNLLNGTIATAIITVSYPVFSKLHAEKKQDALVKNVNKYFSIIVLIMLPITVLCMILNEEIVMLVFGRGEFDMESVKRVGSVFQIYVIATIFAALKELVTRIFYIFEDSKTPMLINIFCIVINIVGSVVLVQFVGVSGIVIATVIATVASCVLEIFTFRKKFCKVVDQNIFVCRGLWKYVIAVILMFVTAMAICFFLQEIFYIVRAFVTMIGAILMYFVMLLLLKEEQIVNVFNRINILVRRNQK